MKINRYIIIIFLLSTVIVSFSTFYALNNSKQSAGLADKAFISEHQIARIERIFTITNMADEGVKNYIITGDDKLLIPSDTSKAKIKRTLRYLKVDLKGDSTLLSDIQTLETYAISKIQFLDALANARKQSFDSAQRMLQSVAGTARIDSVQALVSRLNARERHSRTEFTNLDVSSIDKTKIAIISGEVIAFLIIILVLLVLNRDMLKRVTAEKNVRESEIRYRTIAQNVGSFIYTCDYYGKVTFATPNIIKLTGYSPNEFIGKHFTFMVSPEWITPLEQSYYEQFKNKVKEATTRFEIVTKQGQHKLVEQDVVIFSTDDMMMGFQCMIRDLSEINPG
jgi:PAS domain S-box-containing protein